MTDLDCIEYAVQVVLAKCRKNNQDRATRGIGGDTVMQWFAAALNEAKELRGDRALPQSVECDQCGGSGFDTPGTGYGNVCSKCGGQRELPAEPGAGRELRVAAATRAVYKVLHPEFEEYGQSLEKMRILSNYHDMDFEAIARAALAAAPQGGDNAG